MSVTNDFFITAPSLMISPKAPGTVIEDASRFVGLQSNIRRNCVSPKLWFAMDHKTLNDGVIIVDHGSRRKESNLLLDEFVLMFKNKTKYLIVEPAHMELAEPSIRDAFGSCVQQGANRIIISPFFLFPGRHWHQDIPSLADTAAMEHSGIPYLVTAPLGLHELLVDVVKDRIDYCLSRVNGEVEECSVCAGTGICKLKVQQNLET